MTMLIVGILLGRVVNLNFFSLHAGYRSRLIRAFLGASRPDHERNPNPFTGFDPADNLHMHELQPGLLAEADLIDARWIAQTLRSNSDPLSRFFQERNLMERTRRTLDRFDSVRGGAAWPELGFRGKPCA